MSGKILFLDSHQRIALESNFVLYEPRSRTYHSDFGVLEGCEVILLGEIHRSLTLYKAQELFFQIVARNSCILIETISPGRALRREDVPRWQNIPEEVVIRGSDVRDHGLERDQEITWLSCSYQLVQMRTENREVIQNLFGRVAEVLRQGLASGEASIENGIVQISSGIHAELNAIDEQINAEFEKEEELVRKLNEIGEKVSGKIDLLHSNQGLLQEIRKAGAEYDRVIAVWGGAHFTQDDTLIDELDREGLRYAIVLPNDSLDEIAREEHRWQTEGYDKYILSFKQGDDDSYLEIPEFFRALFEPVIQDIMEREVEEPEESVTLDINTLASLFESDDVLEVPPNVEIRIEGMRSDIHDQLLNLNKVDEEGQALEGGEISAMKKAIIEGINDMLFFSHLTVSSYQLQGEMKLTFDPSKIFRGLALVSNYPFVLQVEQGDLVISAKYMLKQMQDQNISSFEVLPGQKLFFKGISTQWRQAVLDDPNSFLDFLGAEAPHQTRIELEGFADIAGATIKDSNTGEAELGICVEAEESFTIHLVNERTE